MAFTRTPPSRPAGRPIRSAATPRPRRGNGVLEMAIVLPVLLWLGMGMVEFGQYFYAKHTIQAASRDGARTAILGTATHAAAQSAVANTMATGNFGSSTYTLTFVDPYTSTTITNVAAVSKGNPIQVTVTANYGAVGVRPLGVISAAKQIKGITTMIKE